MQLSAKGFWSEVHLGVHWWTSETNGDQKLSYIVKELTHIDIKCNLVQGVASIFVSTGNYVIKARIQL